MEARFKTTFYFTIENIKQSSLHVPSPLVSDHLSKTLKFSQSSRCRLCHFSVKDLVNSSKNSNDTGPT